MKELQLRVAALLHADNLIEALGADPEPLLAQFGLTRADLHHPDLFIDAPRYVEFLECCSDELKCVDFGLRLADRQGFVILGPLGNMLLQCSTAIEAIQAVKTFIPLHSQIEAWDFLVTENALYLTRLDQFHGFPGARQYKELALGLCTRLVNLLFAETVQPIRVAFTHSALGDRKDYLARFRCPVEFNQANDLVVYSSKILVSPLKTKNVSINRDLQNYLEQLIESYKENTELLVRSLIHQTMGEGHCSVDQIARLLHTSRRTLQRRLAEQQLVFKQMVLETRMSLARWYLNSSELPVTQVAQILGYSTASSFSKAFRHYHGTAPTSWTKTCAKLVDGEAG